MRHVEAAESEFLRRLGCTYRDFQAPKFDSPRVRIECDYISPLAYDDLLDIGVTVERVGRPPTAAVTPHRVFLGPMLLL